MGAHFMVQNMREASCLTSRSPGSARTWASTSTGQALLTLPKHTQTEVEAEIFTEEVTASLVERQNLDWVDLGGLAGLFALDQWVLGLLDDGYLSGSFFSQAIDAAFAVHADSRQLQRRLFRLSLELQFGVSPLISWLSLVRSLIDSA